MRNDFGFPFISGLHFLNKAHSMENIIELKDKWVAYYRNIDNSMVYQKEIKFLATRNGDGYFLAAENNGSLIRLIDQPELLCLRNLNCQLQPTNGELKRMGYVN